MSDEQVDALEEELAASKARIAELEADFHKQADMNGRLMTENAELRQRIAELEAKIKSMEYVAADWEAQDRELGEKDNA